MKKFLVLVCVLSLFLAGNVFAEITETGMSQGDLVRLLKSLKTSTLNRTMSSASLTISTWSLTQGATAETQLAFNYTVDGRWYTFAASTNIYLTPTAEQAVSTYCHYLFSINASGKIQVTKGNDASATNKTYLPAAPKGFTVFGAALVKTSAASAFTMGSNQFRPTMLPNAPVWYQLSTEAASQSSMMVLP